MDVANFNFQLCIFKAAKSKSNIYMELQKFIYFFIFKAAQSKFNIDIELQNFLIFKAAKFNIYIELQKFLIIYIRFHLDRCTLDKASWSSEILRLFSSFCKYFKHSYIYILNSVLKLHC